MRLAELPGVHVPRISGPALSHADVLPGGTPLSGT
jgi:hypothetical protein